MNKNEIENWVLRIIEQVQAHQPNEDFRVELKTEWIDPIKAARLIASQSGGTACDLDNKKACLRSLNQSSHLKKIEVIFLPH